ncbi:MAG: hypothetical protein K0Q49_932 [Haloplasmataceae bacterium]|jgi:hypothetical protein|nr:hypothetical protein [Haloplasmataceae bacterium]
MKYLKVLIIPIFMLLVVFITYTLGDKKNKEADLVNQETKTIEFFKGNNDEKIAFKMDNILPGDLEEKQFSIKVFHEEQANLNLKSNKDLNNDLNHLSNVLRVKVSNDGLVLFDGTLSEFNLMSINLESNDEQMSIVNYEIEIFLPIETSNSYQSTGFTGEFIWYAEGKLTSKNDFPFFLVSILVVTTGIFLYVIIKRKGEISHEVKS